MTSPPPPPPTPTQNFFPFTIYDHTKSFSYSDNVNSNTSSITTCICAPKGLESLRMYTKLSTFFLFLNSFRTTIEESRTALRSTRAENESSKTCTCEEHARVARQQAAQSRVHGQARDRSLALMALHSLHVRTRVR